MRTTQGSVLAEESAGNRRKLKGSGGPSRMSSDRRRQYVWCYVFLSPQIVVFLAFVVWPTLASWYFAFFNWDGIGWPSEFVGLDNFREVATDPIFWRAFRNTMIYTAALVAIVVPSTLVLAIILDHPKLKGRTAYRVAFVLPVVLTTAVVGVQMRSLFATQGGTVNAAFEALGLVDEPVAWLDSAGTAMLVVIFVGAWKTFGIKLIYWLAAIQTIPEELHDAAMMDGAGWWQRLRHVTMPLLTPFLVVIVFLQVLDGLRVFDLVKTMTDGGPYFATDMVPLYIYRYAFEPNSVTSGFALPRYGFASAAGIFYGLATFLLAVLFGLLVRKYRNALPGRR